MHSPRETSDKKQSTTNIDQCWNYSTDSKPCPRESSKSLNQMPIFPSLKEENFPSSDGHRVRIEKLPKEEVSVVQNQIKGSDLTKEEAPDHLENQDNSESIDYEEADEEFELEGDEEMLMQKLEQIGDSGRSKHKTFEGIPKQWH